LRRIRINANQTENRAIIEKRDTWNISVIKMSSQKEKHKEKIWILMYVMTLGESLFHKKSLENVV